MSHQPTLSPRKRSLAQIREWRKVEWKKKLRRFEKAEEEIKKFPLGPQYKAGLRRPSPVWRLFPRQKLAFDFARCCKQDVHVFACEVEGESENGQRKYLVTTYEQFWDMYSVLHPNMDGHFYEVIPEGATCHLYFDLEFSKVVNPGSDGVAMVQTLIRCVCWFLKKKYNLTCTEEHVLDLESSTEEKFSHHLIFHLPGAAFQDNIHAGNFVHQMCEKLYLCTEQQSPLAGDAELQELREAVPGLDQLVMKNKDGDRVLFIDAGVYTKNRNFRLYQSTKLGRRAPMLVSPQCKYKLREGSKASWEGSKACWEGSKACWDQQVFLESLVSNVRFSPELRVLRCEEGNSSSGRVSTSRETGDNSTGRDSTTREATDQLSGCSSSPYPEVDAYVILQASSGGVYGGIRQWTYFSQGEVLMYDIAHNRWCENIGRAHRSNHVMFVADLKRQVLYQKCHDPVCRAQNYKSPERPLPAEVLPAFILEEDQLWDSGVEDEDLLSALSSQEAETDSDVTSWDTDRQEPPEVSQEVKTEPDVASWDADRQEPFEVSQDRSCGAVKTSWDAEQCEPSDQDLLAAIDLAMTTTAKRDGKSWRPKTAAKRESKSPVLATAAKRQGKSQGVTRTVDDWEVSDRDLLLAANSCHGNDSRKTLITVDIGAQRNCHVNDSRKREITVDTCECEVSDSDLLAAANCCHGNNNTKTKTVVGAQRHYHDNNSSKLQATVDKCEVSDEDLLTATQGYHGNHSGQTTSVDSRKGSVQCCHDDNSRKTQTTVDSCEISDEDLLVVAAQPCLDGSVSFDHKAL
ncbi:DNA-directed primase/polymerase protein-like [Branchiostoma floridae]|uniref:DNA-directed primase/polymerase protein n=1 Tax=Branchiostoma floridae TaxID=7739 RepID=A0A9J7HQK8_BRAFL|nr:DNA-directed primase/polymerase protein-like [Branchiostoma floridae]